MPGEMFMSEADVKTTHDQADPQPAEKEPDAPQSAAHTEDKPEKSKYFKNWAMKAMLVVLLIVVAVIAYFVWLHFQPKKLGAGFVSGNGRIEGVELSIAAKAPGRIRAMYFDEGDSVRAGQVVVQMDTSSLDAQLRQAQADELQARNATSTAWAMVALQQSQQVVDRAMLAQREAELAVEERTADRARTLSLQHAVSMQDLDEYLARQRVGTAAVVAAKAQLAAAQSRVSAAEFQALGASAKIAATQAAQRQIQTEIDDAALKTARGGRIQYRIAQPGEVVGAGGKVLGMVDLTDMSITFFLPEAAAGRIAVGTEVHIVLDADPERVVPADVSFVAIVAQFTPKSVETQSEREKLVFRVKARISPETLGRSYTQIKSGMPAVAYIRLDSTVPWPAELALKAAR